MRIEIPHKFLLFLILMPALTGIVFAQKRVPDRGPKQNTPFSQTGPDSVNLTNGNVFLSIPVASLPKGRGDSPDFPVSLNYNSKIWDMRRERRHDGAPVDGGGTSYFAEVLVPADNGGWSIGVGYRLIVRSRTDLESPVPCDGSDEMDRNAFIFRVELRSPDGTERELRPVGFSDIFSDGYHNVDPNGTVYRWSYSTVGDGSASCSLTRSQFNGDMVYRSVDGSHLQLVVRRVAAETNGAENPWSLSFPDGSMVENLPADDAGVVQRMSDRNGNRAYLKRGSFNGGEAVFVEDDFGRRTVIQSTPKGQSIFRTGFGGESLETRIEWKTVYVFKAYNAADLLALNAPQSARNTELLQPMSVLDRIVLPRQAGGLEYSFEYNGADSRPQDTYTKGWGELTGVRLPSGAKIEYRYQLDETGVALTSGEVVRNPVSRRALTYLEEADGKASTVSEVRTYSIGVDASTVTEPDGNTVHTKFVNTASGSCGAGLVLSTRESDGTFTENLWADRCSDPYVQLQFRTLADSSGVPSVTSAVQTLRDADGNLLERHEYGNVPYASVQRVDGRPSGVSSDMRLIRSEVNEYYYPSDPPSSGPAPARLRNLLKSSEVRDSVGRTVSRSEFEYDEPDSKGNLTVTRRWSSTKGPMTAPDPRGFRLSADNAVVTQTSYDEYGNAVLLTDARGFQTEIVYGDVGGAEKLYPTEKTEAARTSVSMRTSAEYDLSTGLLTKEIFFGNSPEENAVKQYSFDAIGRPLRTDDGVGTASHRCTRFEYDDARRISVTRSDAKSSCDGGQVLVEHYDQLGRLRLRRELEGPWQDAADERQGIKVQFRYSTAGGAIQTLVSNPYRTETSNAPGHDESMGWRRVRSDRRTGLSEEETFKGPVPPLPWGSNTASTGRFQVRTSGDLKMTVDPAGKRRISRADPLGRITDVWEMTSAGDESVMFAGVASRGFRTAYTHDVADNLKSVRQGVQSRTFGYDSLSRMVSSSSPEAGTVRYEHDAGGNVIMQTDARGVGIRMFYDALNRIVNRSYTTDAVDSYIASPDVTYSYDDYRVPFSRGRLTRIHSTVADERTTRFDSLGRVVSSEQVMDGRTYAVSYRYDLGGRLVEQTYPSGRKVGTEFSDDGRLTAVRSERPRYGRKTLASNFSYDASGNTRGFRQGNGLWETAVFDSRLQLLKVSLGRFQGLSDLLGVELSYGGHENNGNVVAARIDAAGSAPRFQSYGYDDLNRLSTASETSGGSLQWRQAFIYDRFGNRRWNESQTTTLLRNCVSGFVKVLCGADRKRVNPSVSERDNRLIEDQDLDGVVDYRHDPSGNVTRDASGTLFFYDSEHRQVQIKDSSGNLLARYAYDGLGRRVKKTAFVNNQPYETTVFVYNAMGRTVAEYSDRTVPASAARLHYLTADHLGSPRAVADQYGKVIARHDYHPFGEEIERFGRGSDGVRRKFTGYERDLESDLDFAGARYYAYRIGRFTSPDPAVSSISLALPQSLNRYSYVMNNPLRFVDPNGEDWVANTGGDRRSNPYRWVDRCATGQVCWTSVAYDTGSGVRVYGTRGAQDVSFYGANESGQVNVDLLLSHPDSKVLSVAMSQGLPEPYLSSRAAAVVYNLGVRYSGRFPNDEKLVFANGNAANGKPCVYPSGKSCHRGHKGGDMDLRYMDSAGRALIGAAAYLSADPERTRFIVDFMRGSGFPESFSGDSARLGTNPASPGTARVHRNHLHIGIDDEASNRDAARK